MLAKYRYVKHYIFTGTDMDSVTSYMVFNWLSDKRIPVQYVTRDNIEETAKKFLADHPDTLVYFINLDTSTISNIVDRRHVLIIDHHKSHIDKKSAYSNCKPILKPCSSCCKLIYTLLRKRLPGNLTTDQLRLMFMVDDYESYTFNIPNSYELGVVFNNLQGDRSVRFYSKFVNGVKFAQPRFYFSRKNKLDARALSDWEQIKLFFKHNSHTTYPYRVFSETEWGFDYV